MIRFGSIVDDLKNARSRAQGVFDDWWMDRYPDYNNESNVSWHIETAFLKLLVATEALGLQALKGMIIADMSEAKASKKGFAQQAMGPEEPYSIWLARLSQHLAALQTLVSDQGLSITKDLSEILRATLYSITDLSLFPGPPSSEDDVHRRIEGVLKCVFPDLRHKPRLTKPIKNFEPDTGLPSIGTLIEYKFLSHRNQVSVIADQVLADTRGYAHKDWHTFLYVIYEARRIKPEFEWNLLLRECNVPESTSLIVLSGEPPASRRRGTLAKGSSRDKPSTRARRPRRLADNA